jgi:hypothetical protein
MHGFRRTNRAAKLLGDLFQRPVFDQGSQLEQVAGADELQCELAVVAIDLKFLGEVVDSGPVAKLSSHTPSELEE